MNPQLTLQILFGLIGLSVLGCIIAGAIGVLRAVLRINTLVSLLQEIRDNQKSK